MDRTFGEMLLGRVIPHVLAFGYVLYFPSESVGTIRGGLWVLIPLYAVFAAGHTYAGWKRMRLPFVLLLTGAAGALILAASFLIPDAPEAGAFYKTFFTTIILLFLGFSAVVNTLFVSTRYFYLAEVALFLGAWLLLEILPGGHLASEALLLSLPVLAYALYVLLFDYAFLEPVHGRDRKKLLWKFAGALAVLLLALLGGIAGIGESSSAGGGADYSMLSKQNDLYTMQERASMEDKYRIPLDSKELVLVANIDPTVLGGENRQIGYYLKFHSLYNYDPASSEFNTLADEMEDPNFYVRSVPISATQGIPTHLTYDESGNPIVPPYSLRTDGKATVYNIQLNTNQSFGNNLTYRFVSYPGTDSLTIGEKTMPVLGVYRLFNKISLLNAIPIGTSGVYSEIDFNDIMLERAEEYMQPGDTPASFTQRYLRYDGLEPDIIDSMKTLLRGRETVRDKILTVIEFFTQQDENGNQVFTYDVEPGSPPGPDQSRLHYFLMKNRRGYCTYYATAATLFLRVAGIPARVAIGFVPGETSSKNPGWYYIYSQQGHAWTEVYLGPQLGWIDLDVTPAADNEIGPPPPDPTPPTPPLPVDPLYRYTGVAKSGEIPPPTIPERLDVRTEAQDELYCTTFTERSVILLPDTAAGAGDSLPEFSIGDTLIAIGSRSVNNDADDCGFDEFYYRELTVKKRKIEDTTSAAVSEPESDLTSWLLPVGIALMVLILGLLSTPTVHLWLLARAARSARQPGKRLSLTRAWSLMMLQMHGIQDREETDEQFAARLASEHGIEMREFMRAYLHHRYYRTPESVPQSVYESAMFSIRAYFKGRDNAVVRIIRQMNFWQYMRIINRGKTA
ncbi:MAG: hypothetical protein CL946_10625 [Ectothiorhodospiraceae bacterium]|nr:hypothetical protein [Ectothiorhodospiraceae bacterium]